MPGVVSLCFPAGHPWSGVWVRRGGDAGNGRCMANMQSQCLLGTGLHLCWSVKGLSVVWAGNSLCYPSLEHLHIIPL